LIKDTLDYVARTKWIKDTLDYVAQTKCIKVPRIKQKLENKWIMDPLDYIVTGDQVD
jgi:hypothetical protein